MIKRLLPLFEQSAPATMVESLRAQLNALNTIVPEAARTRDDEWMNRGVRPDKPAEDREQALLNRIERAKTSEERDSLYVELIFMIAERGEMRARDYYLKSRRFGNTKTAYRLTSIQTWQNTRFRRN